ncbi:unnamed protein product [Protopolystoma xenopodis]|uniref:Uncharacterized protein n=1 Tax=Protopolystoma xenopodis TaxID=117903 RepID=A0A3S5CN08_9PLAT|nr:unnamed protein product [Protopolystoma xenopodis]
MGGDRVKIPAIEQGSPSTLTLNSSGSAVPEEQRHSHEKPDQTDSANASTGESSCSSSSCGTRTKPPDSGPHPTKNSPSTSNTVHNGSFVLNASGEYETRRLLSELHQAWMEFDPLCSALTRVNRQLDVLQHNPPK